MDIVDVWKHAQNYIMSDINSDVAYNTYLKDAFAVSYEGSVFTIGVALPTRKNIIEIKYKKIIESAISRVIAEPVSLKIIISDNKEQAQQNNLSVENNTNQSANEVKIINETHSSTNLNPRYTFEKLLISRHAVNPSIFGSIRSSKIRLMLSSWARRTASSPSNAVKT